MARLNAFGKSAAVRVDILVDKNSAMPSGTIRLTHLDNGKTADTALSFEELLALVAGLSSDPRLKTGGRNPPPDAGLKAGVDDLFAKVKQS